MRSQKWLFGLVALAGVACGVPADPYAVLPGAAPPSLATVPSGCQRATQGNPAGQYGYSEPHFPDWGFDFTQPNNQTCVSGIATGTNVATVYYEANELHELHLLGYKKAGGVDTVDLEQETPTDSESVQVTFTVQSTWGGYAVIAVVPPLEPEMDIDGFFELTTIDAVTGVSAQRTGPTSAGISWTNDADSWTTLVVIRDGTTELESVSDAAGYYEDTGLSQTSHSYDLYRVRDLPDEMSRNTTNEGPHPRSRTGPTENVGVNLPPLSITSPATLPQGNKTTPYSYTLLATGGWGTKTWSIISGSLPTGISLNSSTGELSGTPSAHGTFNLTAQVSASGYNATKGHSLTINQFPLSVSFSQWPDPAKSNKNCTWGAVGTGGTGSYSYSWYKDSTYVGGGSPRQANTGLTSFWMRVSVTDGIATVSDSVHTNVTSSSPSNCTY